MRCGEKAGKADYHEVYNSLLSEYYSTVQCAVHGMQCLTRIAGLAWHGAYCVKQALISQLLVHAERSKTTEPIIAVEGPRRLKESMIKETLTCGQTSQRSLMSDNVLGLRGSKWRAIWAPCIARRVLSRSSCPRDAPWSLRRNHLESVLAGLAMTRAVHWQ